MPLDGWVTMLFTSSLVMQERVQRSRFSRVALVKPPLHCSHTRAHVAEAMSAIDDIVDQVE